MIALLSAYLMNAPDLDPAPGVYGFTVKSIDGKPVKLDKYRGKTLLIVNVASRCGLTPQYAGLEKIYREYKDRGLVVLGFPANDFGGQEPGSDTDIKTFCTTKYDVTFPMFSKISVKDEVHPLYRFLLDNSGRPNDPIEWNFSKFVVSRDGKSVVRLKPQDTPDSPSLRAAIEAALTR